MQKNKRPIIGILNTLKIVEGHPYDTVYKTIDLYVKKIESIDCIPLGIIDIEHNQEILELCDAFILPGGNRITKDHYYIIRHCIDNNKPLLGICLGMQSMIFYDFLTNQLDANNSIEDLYYKYQELKKKEISILNKVSNVVHGGDLVLGVIDANYDNVLNSKHLIEIQDNSLLRDIYKVNTKKVISLHQYGVYQATKLFKEIAYAEDGVLEAIQYYNDNYFILGLQFHAEADDDNLIFERLKQEIMDRS